MAAKKRGAGSAHFIGSWRITEMEVWDRDAIDLVGPAHIVFGAEGHGSFRFIAVEGQLDCRFAERDGLPFVEFSWTGHDEMDPASGRGFATVEGDVMGGRIFFHDGDESAFTAKRQTSLEPAGPARGRRRSTPPMGTRTRGRR